MAYFSEIDENGIVKRTVVVDESVKDGEEFAVSLFGGQWIESTKTPGKLMAGIGYKYLPDHEGFQSPRPYDSWSFNADSWQWEAPVPMPADDSVYVWNEDSGSWEVIDGYAENI